MKLAKVLVIAYTQLKRWARIRRIYVGGTCLVIVLCLPLAFWMGCGSGPFQISGPSSDDEPVGFALVSADVPLYIRGVIQRVNVDITTADTSRMAPILREMNFPIPGGSLAAGEVTDISVGRRLFSVSEFDTQEALRFQGSVIDSIRPGQATTVSVPLNRIGGTLRFTASLSRVDISDSLAVILEGTSVLDIVELGAKSDMPRLALASTPIVSFTRDGSVFSRQVTISQVPTGQRIFAGNLRDLSLGSRFLSFTDTVSATVDTEGVVDVKFSLQRVDRLLSDPEFVLPSDSTIVVISPNF